MKRIAAAIAVAALVSAGLTVDATAQGAVRTQPVRRAHSQPAAGYVPPPIKWGTCKNATLRQHQAQCGFLVVPLSYAKPRGAKIRLAVSRIRHTTTPYQGVMLVNPGGPGGSGLVLSVLEQYVPGQSAHSYDWIGYDPRGVGSSRPRLSCIGGYSHFDRPPYVPRTKKLMQIWLNRARHYANACANSKAARLLPHLRTVDNVRDMDSLRKALAGSGSTTTGSPTAPTSASSTRPCTRTGCAGSCWTATWTRDGSGTRGTWTRTSRSTAT